MKTLIITVGTRQTGWRCSDGIIRCFGADGDRAHPRHIDELYAQVGMERSHHEGTSFLWSVRHLGEYYYSFCASNNDYSAVELLLDQQIIEDQLPQGLSQIILWGTDQPETVSWKFRRADTLWLAELMAGKLRSLYPSLSIICWHPTLAADDHREALRQVENLISQQILQPFSEDQKKDFVLLIENKGSVPAIASSLEIVAAALVRQIQVELLTPDEPEPLFISTNSKQQSVQSSQTFRRVLIGEYFWPLERDRIISAWKRGDFREAELWLSGYRSRLKPVYQLAGYLALCSNWQIPLALRQIAGGWLRSNAVRSLTPPEQLAQMQEQMQQLNLRPTNTNSEVAQIWESWFLIYLETNRQNYTLMFWHFVLMLERLLFLRFNSEDWLEKRYIDPLNNQWGRSYKPGFGELIIGWQTLNQLDDQNSWVRLLNRIRELRNRLAHKSQPVTFTDIQDLWLRDNLFSIPEGESMPVILELMHKLFVKISAPDWQIPEYPLLELLYKWGLEKLESA